MAVLKVSPTSSFVVDMEAFLKTYQTSSSNASQDTYLYFDGTGHVLTAFKTSGVIKEITVTGQSLFNPTPWQELTISKLHLDPQGLQNAVSNALLTQDPGDLVGFILSGNDKITGNNNKDILGGYAGRDKISGAGGEDILTGGEGADTFVFKTGFGKDSVTDFHATGKKHDVVDLSHLAAVKDFADLKAHHMSSHNGDVWIEAGHGDKLILEDLKPVHLDKQDFHF